MSKLMILAQKTRIKEIICQLSIREARAVRLLQNMMTMRRTMILIKVVKLLKNNS